MSSPDTITGPALKQFIRDALGDSAADALETDQGMHLWGSIGCDAYLCSDGSIGMDEYDDLQDPSSVKRRPITGIERITHLAIAARRRPQLNSLLPSPTHASKQCPQCHGEKTLNLDESQRGGWSYLDLPSNPLRVWCGECGGVGFVG